MRQLTGWEKVVSEVFKELGFRYFANVRGGGYWIIPDQYTGQWKHACGLQLTHNINIDRHGGFYWELTRIEGLKIYKARLTTRKRDWQREAQDIKHKIVQVIEPKNWKSNPRWYLDADLGN